MPKININAVEPNARVYITGQVAFSRIASQIDGDELAADNARRATKGLRPIDKPHTRLTLNNCRVDFADPTKPTVAEQYIIENKFYASGTHPELGKTWFTGENKTKNLPAVFCRADEVSKEIVAITPEGELAAGTPVTITLRFFAAQNNIGVSLDSIIVNEKPVRYYSSSAASALAERGFKVVNDADVDAVQARLNANTAVPAPIPAAPTAVPAPAAASYAQPVAPAPAPAPVAAPAPTAAGGIVPPEGYTIDANGRIVPKSSVQGGITL